MEELFKAIPDYLKAGDEIVIDHFSPSQLEKPLCLWSFQYLHLKERRRDMPVGAPAPAGGALHDCLQAIVCDGANEAESIVDDYVRDADISSQVSSEIEDQIEQKDDYASQLDVLTRRVSEIEELLSDISDKLFTD